jgi:superfamily II DNA or RNA helicase
MTKLWQHQQEAISWVLDQFAAGKPALLDMGMGTGKTRCALEIAASLLAKGSISRILVGCPRAVIDAWATTQIPRWLPEVRVLALTQATSKKKSEAIEAALADTSPLIVVGNYESLWRMPVTLKVKWGLVVWDEVHRLKAVRGSASKWASKMAKTHSRCCFLGMSGTLLAHSPLDAFGVWRAVGHEVWGRSFTSFKASYAVTNPHIPGMVMGWRNQTQMSKIIAETTFRRTTEQVIKWLPELTHEMLEFDLAPEEARVYRELLKEFASEVAEGTITPANAMVGVLRGLQVCGGFVGLDDDGVNRRSVRLTNRPSKQSRFGEMLQDLDPREPLVVFCRFRDDIDCVIEECESHGRSVSELSGKINQLAQWQAGETSTLVTQIQSGGIGIDLTRASIGVFYSVGHSLSEFLQAVARLHRPGQERATRLYSLVARLPTNSSASLERRVYEALRERKDVIDTILDGYRRQRAAAAAGAGEHPN